MCVGFLSGCEHLAETETEQEFKGSRTPCESTVPAFVLQLPSCAHPLAVHSLHYRTRKRRGSQNVRVGVTVVLWPEHLQNETLVLALP